MGRYSFTTEEKETLVQSAENYTQEIAINRYDDASKINVICKELTVSRMGTSNNDVNDVNTTAFHLEGFIDSVRTNGGYYIARYEASYGEDKKANSKVSDKFSMYGLKEEGALWNYITQIEAVNACRNIYTDGTTDLVNSYAWDTAFVFMKKCANYHIEYPLYLPNIGNLVNTGTNQDEGCKINDMVKNGVEWTTEYNTTILDSEEATITASFPCTTRRGMYAYSNTIGGYKYVINNGGLHKSGYTFRPILYI